MTCVLKFPIGHEYYTRMLPGFTPLATNMQLQNEFHLQPNSCFAAILDCTSDVTSLRTRPSLAEEEEGLVNSEFRRNESDWLMTV